MKGITGAVLLLVGLAAAAPAVEAKTIGTSSASGTRAMAVARGEVQAPRAIQVTVTTRPRQVARVSWFVVCSKRLRPSQANGTARGSGTFSRSVGLPVRAPGRCAVSAIGRLAGTGRITVVLTAES